MNNKTISKKTVTVAFLLVPFLASIVSGLHVFKFFSLGDSFWLAFCLSIIFEVGSVASFIALAVLDKIKKGFIYFIFALLIIMQLVGNVYSVFEYANAMLAVHPTWLANFVELLTPLFGKVAPATYKFILAMFIGIPIPLISLSFLKSLVDYLEVTNTEEPIPTNETVTVRPQEPVAEAPTSIAQTDGLSIPLAPTPSQILKHIDEEAANEVVSPAKESTKPLWDDPWPALTLKTTTGDDPNRITDEDIAKYANIAG